MNKNSEENNTTKDEGKKSLTQKGRQILSALKHVSVEPAGFFLWVAVFMNYIMSLNLILDRACRVNNGFAAEVCDDIKNNVNKGNYTEEEKAIQNVVANVQIYKSLLVNACPMLYVLFLGPWSDKYGRKVPLLLPTFGYCLQSVLLVIFSVVESADAYVILLTATLSITVIGGSTRIFAMGAMSYIGDTSTDNVRTVRIGFYRCCSALGYPVGFALGAALIKSSLSPTTCFLISTVVSGISLFLVIFCVKNTPHPSIKKEEGTEGLGKSAAKSALDPRNALKVLSVPFKKRENNGRLKLILLLGAYVCVLAPFIGEFKVIFMYLRYHLKWDMGDYGAFSSYNALVAVAGTFIAMGVLSYALKLNDAIVGFVSGISQLIGTFMYAFATSGLMIYIASTVDMMNGTMAVVLKSMISKLVGEAEFGQVFAFVGVLEALTPYVADPVYIALYKYTFQIFAGSFYFFSIALTIPPQLIFLLFIWKKWSAKTDVKDTEVAKESNAYFGDVEGYKAVPKEDEFTVENDKAESIGMMNGEIKSSRTSLKQQL